MSKKMKLATRVLSIFLSMVLLLEVVPMQVFAEEKSANDIVTEAATEEANSDTVEETDNSENEESEPAQILSEDTEKREENVKHFRMSDGTMQAAQYAEPVHFLKDGVWTDYDNTLTEVDADEEGNEGRTLLKNKDLTNQTADYSVRLSKKTNGKKFVRIEKDGYKLSWYYVGASKSTAKVAKAEDDGDPTTLEKVSSAVTYKDVFKSTDLEYILGSTGLKENLILGSKKAPTAFTAEYKANWLTPVQIDEKTIELRASDGMVVYTLSAPYMEDANGESSTDVTLTLGEIKNDTFRVTLTLDSVWLQTEDRVYPVTVDPVIQTKQEKSEMISTFVDSGHPNTAHGKKQSDLGSMYVGRQIDEFGTAKTYIKVKTLPDIGDVASKVIDARLSVCKRNTFEINKKDLRINAYQVTSSWDVGSLTYYNQPSYDGNIVDYMQFAADNKVQSDYHDNYGYPEFKTIEITDLVRGWYENTQSNYGIMLDTEATNLHKVWFFSIQYTTYPETRPVLTVSYRNMSGYEDYWSFTNVSAGRGGVASVNNFNGNFVFAQPIAESAGGNLMSVELSLVYNANKEEGITSKLGVGMQTNLHLYVRYDRNLVDSGYNYYFNDADGTKHWLKKETENNKTVYKDEDGLGYTLTEISKGSVSTAPDAVFELVDKDENKMYFDWWGNLVQLKNPSGVTNNFTYTNADGDQRLETITDGAGRVYTFSYAPNTSRQVSKITDPAGRETTFTYDNSSPKKLTAIHYADGKSVVLSYTNNLLSEIQGIDGTRTKISYDSSAQKRVTQINWGSSDSNLLEKYSFSYKQNSTTVNDILNGRSYTYQFNDWGQTTGVVSNADGSAQFFKLHAGNSTDSRANKLIQESRVLQTVTNYVRNPGFTRAYSDGYVNYVENTANQSISIDASKKNITNNALKIYKAASNTGRVNAVQIVNGLDTGTYTFSAHVNTDGATLAGGAWLLAEVWNGTSWVSSNWGESTVKTDGWERKSVTFNVSAGQQVRLILGFGDSGSGTVSYDDLQLEKGEGESTFNLVENSGFTNGKTQWSSDSTKTSSGNLHGLPNCIYTNGDPADRWKGISQQMLVAGKANDVYTFGAWVKADSVPIDNGTKEDQANKPAFNLSLHYYNADGSWKGCKSVQINADLKNQWQFVSGEYIIPNDYYKIAIELIYFNNANTVSITGAFCYKEQYGQTYDYDKDGNVVSTVDLAKTNSAFSYYGSQMSRMLNPSGSAYMYTYDDKKQLTYALSSDGQQYGFAYDDKGNVTKAEITARKPATTIESGKEYYVINAYSGLALDSFWAGNSGDNASTYRYTPGSSEQIWKLEAVSGTTDVFRLKTMVAPAKNLYLDVKNAYAATGTMLQIANSNSGNAQKFKIVKERDNTFSLFTGNTNYEKLVDGQYNSNEIIQSRGVYQNDPYPNKDEPCYGQRWYFYPVEKSEDKTIVTETTYTNSKNFVASTKDQRGNETSYTYNEQKGTLTSTTDALGRTTNYSYDPNNNSLLSVSSGGMTNSYAYENDRLKNITVNGGLRYAFEYDAFGRRTNTKVGNGTEWRTLSSLEYDKGLLKKQNYGNGNYIEYTYDNLDRITEKKYNGDANNRAVYRYGNDGSLAQTVDFSTGTRTKFTYDLADRLVTQKEYTGTGTNGGTLRSSTDFTYADKTNYLTGVKHFSPLGTQNIGYTYGDVNQGQMPDQVYKVSWNGQEKVNYAYDGLGRLTNKSVILSASEESPLQRLTHQYTYVDVGTDKTTSLVQSVQTAAGTYSYTYDAVGNITSVSNGSYTTSYVYDDLNQLVRVNDQRAAYTYTYEYENGNILSQKQYAYTTGSLEGMSYTGTKWQYGDGTWSDLMTGLEEIQGVNGGSETGAAGAVALQSISENAGQPKTKGIFSRAMAQRNSGVRAYSMQESTSPSFTYDTIGNPTNILGIEMEWQGRQLTELTAPEDSYASHVAYAYNTDGQRVSKTVTLAEDPVAQTTEYFYNGEILAGQKTGDTVITFMYDNNGDYFGFTVNGTPYYYVKNAQNDVMAVTDANGEILLYYLYDAWGWFSIDIVGDDDTAVAEAVQNPITYRSYYMDFETGFFYLNSRYYISFFCRFLNADGIYDTHTGVLSHNMFTYCNNNPVNMIDSEGTGPRWDKFKQKVSDIWNCVVDWFSGDGGEYANAAVDIIDGVKNYTNAVRDATEDCQTHIQNVINANSNVRKKPAPKEFKNQELNIKISPNSDASRYAYSIMETSALMIFDISLSEMTWEDVEKNPELKEMLIRSYCAWDEQTMLVISVQYGVEFSVEQLVG